MRLLFLAIFLFTSTAYAQEIPIREIKFKADSKFYKVKDTTIIYPIVVTKSPAVNKLINDKVRSEVIGPIDEKATLRKELEEWVSSGLINLSYEITFQKNGILSLNVYTEGCGAYCTSYYTYFNFDLETGKSLKVADLVNETGFDTLQKIVFADKIAF
jgi:hypothetical protein